MTNDEELIENEILEVLDKKEEVVNNYQERPKMVPDENEILEVLDKKEEVVSNYPEYQKIDPKLDNFGERIFAEVFKSMGARPEMIMVPNVLLTKDSELELYVKGGRSEIFLSEKQGKDALRTGETLYKVRIYRVE